MASNVVRLGTEPRKLRRNDHPDTSQKSAQSVQSAKYEQLALDVHLEAGLRGCTLDDLRKAFADRAPPNTQYTNRRTGLHQKGLILDTGTRRIGESGKEQAVYVARSLLSPEWVEYIKQHPVACNPCFHPKLNEDVLMKDPTRGQPIASLGRVIAHPPQPLSLFDEACDRLFDMLQGDDGEAWIQAERFLKAHRPDLYNRLGMSEPNTETTNEDLPPTGC